MPPSTLPIQFDDWLSEPQDGLLEFPSHEPIVLPEPPNSASLLRQEARSLQRWLDLSA